MNRGEQEEWTVKTELGKLVQSGQVNDINYIFDNNLKIKEPGIVDRLLTLEEDVLHVGRAKRPFKKTQRMTDSGRRQKFFVMVAVGNKNGFVGIGIGKAWEYGPALRKALNAAKLNLARVPLACGSWECGCLNPHSLPFISHGSSGSIRIDLIPAPKGTGLATNDTAKVILRLAGVKDVWSKSKGRTKCRMNMAKATYNALLNVSRLKK